MAYQLQHDEALPQGLKRIAREEVQAAAAELADVQPGAEAVHDARKRMKKLRGLLRLLRPALGAAYQQENARYRDIARSLSGVRDADVLIENFAQLRQAYADRLSGGKAQKFEDYLQQRRNQARVQGGELHRVLPELRGLLDRGHLAIDDWPLDEPGFALVAGGLKQVYRRMRGCYRSTLQAPSAVRFHEWRKQVKYHWYHVRILQACKPGELGRRAMALKELSDTLGTEHDLTVLRQVLQSAAGAVIAQEESLDVMEVLVEEQQRHRQAAWRLAQGLHDESPKALVNRLQGYWQDWSAC